MHPDEEMLGLLALGETTGSAEDRQHLDGCADCTRELEGLRHVVDLGRELGPDDLTAPAAGVWARIRAELGFAPEPRDDDAAGLGDDPVRMPPPASSEVTAYAVLAAADAAYPTASATAELATDGLGRRVLQLVLDADLPEVGLRQAWLVHRDDPSRRRALGLLDGRHGVWTIDHAIDLEAWAVLEVAHQPVEETNDPGSTVVRGELVLAG